MSNEPTTICMTTSDGFELSLRIAKALQASNLIPEQFRGNLADCLIGLNMANRMGTDPLMVLQNLNIVHGRPTFSAKFMIASFNSCGKFAPISYEFGGEGDEYGCEAITAELRGGKEIRGPKVTWGIAKAEGWVDRRGSKWKTGMKNLMYRYRAATWLINSVAPEITMGMQSSEEMSDVIDVTPTPINNEVSLPDLPVLEAQPEEQAEEQIQGQAEEQIQEQAEEQIQGQAAKIRANQDGEIYGLSSEGVWFEIGGVEFDADVFVIDPEHQQPRFTKEGSFRVRRGMADKAKQLRATPPAQPPAQPPEQPSEQPPEQPPAQPQVQPPAQPQVQPPAQPQAQPPEQPRGEPQDESQDTLINPDRLDQATSVDELREMYEEGIECTSDPDMLEAWRVVYNANMARLVSAE